jgi:hypothetical protein
MTSEWKYLRFSGHIYSYSSKIVHMVIPILCLLQAVEILRYGDPGWGQVGTSIWGARLAYWYLI